MNIAIIGSELTELMAGYWQSQKGHRITIFEKLGNIGELMGGLF